LRANPAIPRAPKIHKGLIAPQALTLVLLASPELGPGPARISDVSDWVVVLFGLLLWASCLLSLLALGVHAMSIGRSKRARHKRSRQAKQGV
jgi:hypothetical protein